MSDAAGRRARTGVRRYRTVSTRRHCTMLQPRRGHSSTLSAASESRTLPGGRSTCRQCRIGYPVTPSRRPARPGVPGVTARPVGVRFMINGPGTQP
eukprot:220422-Hanusia_phi.AAC.1